MPIQLHPFDSKSFITKRFEEFIKGKPWAAIRYNNSGIDQVTMVLSDIVTKSLTPSVFASYADTSGNIYSGIADNYVMYLYTWVYLEDSATVTTTIASDDGSVTYINGEIVFRLTSYSSGSATLNFNKGWNLIEVMQYEGSGGDSYALGKTLSSIPNYREATWNRSEKTTLEKAYDNA